MGKECCEEHPNHSEELTRINRACGQLEGIKKMIDSRRYCPDILIQLKAIRSALRSIEAGILERHLASCVKDAVNSKNQEEIDEKLAELSQLFKRFD